MLQYTNEAWGVSTDGGQSFNIYHKKFNTLEECQKYCDDLNNGTFKKAKFKFTPVFLKRDERHYEWWNIA